MPHRYYYVRYFAAGASVGNMPLETDVMRPWLFIALLVLGTATVTVAPASAQQEQTESKRKLVNRPEPMYPSLARSMKISGSVRIEAVVAPNGSVKSTSVIGGHPVLAQSAVDAVRRCKWEPSSHETHEIVVLNFHPE